ncbi:hypothetical protein EDB83DRAFT_2558165 [Lactarius deliciosus]|nr:hypothetical protein EDB83DRAFT_2558165 [Lactarius deliciosus]
MVAVVVVAVVVTVFDSSVYGSCDCCHLVTLRLYVAVVAVLITPSWSWTSLPLPYRHCCNGLAIGWQKWQTPIAKGVYGDHGLVCSEREVGIEIWTTYCKQTAERCTEPSPCEFVGRGDPAEVTEVREKDQVRSVRNGDSQCEGERTMAGTSVVGLDESETSGDAVRGGKTRRDAISFECPRKKPEVLNTKETSSYEQAKVERVGVDDSPWRREPRASEDKGDESGEREGVEIDGEERAVASRCDRYGKPAMRRRTETERQVLYSEHMYQLYMQREQREQDGMWRQQSENPTDKQAGLLDAQKTQQVSVLTAVLYYPLRNPAAYERLQAEVDGAFPGGEELLDVTKLNQMEWLKFQ